MSLTRGLYAGSFDPVTLGHSDIIGRASQLFDELIVAVACNIHKASLFTSGQRVAMLEKVCSKFSNVSVIAFDGLTVDFAHEHQVTSLVRGLRNVADFEAERSLSQINYTLSDGLDTVFLATSPQYMSISSSLVKELIHMQAYDRLTDFVEKDVSSYIENRL